MADAQVQILGEVSQALPQPKIDNVDSAPIRIGKYNELAAINLFPDFAGHAVEGTYLTVNNAQSGLATAAAPTAFSATNPFFLIYNTENPANPMAKDILLDYLNLLCTAAGTAATSIQAAVTLDQGNRYSSGGTEVTNQVVNPNGRFSKASVAKVYAGNITAAAASGLARTVVGNRFLKGAIGVAGDQYTLKFGGIDSPSFIGISTITTTLQNLPKIVVPPNWSALVHLWLPAQSAAASFAPEAGWVER